MRILMLLSFIKSMLFGSVLFSSAYALNIAQVDEITMQFITDPSIDTNEIVNNLNSPGSSRFTIQSFSSETPSSTHYGPSAEDIAQWKEKFGGSGPTQEQIDQWQENINNGTPPTTEQISEWVEQFRGNGFGPTSEEITEWIAQWQEQNGGGWPIPPDQPGPTPDGSIPPLPDQTTPWPDHSGPWPGPDGSGTSPSPDQTTPWPDQGTPWPNPTGGGNWPIPDQTTPWPDQNNPWPDQTGGSYGGGIPTQDQIDQWQNQYQQ